MIRTVAIALLLTQWCFHPTSTLRQRILLNWILAAAGLCGLLSTVHSLLPVPPEWDFGCYYLYGLVAKSGANFYLPLSIDGHPLAGQFSNDFLTEAVAVGFPYPPPTMLLFLPLAELPYVTSYLCWSAINLVALIAAAAVFHRALNKPNRSETAPPFSLLAALFVLWPAVNSSFEFSQSNSLALLAISAALLWINGIGYGAFVALGSFVKPWIGLLLGLSILTKRWRATCAGLFTVLALMSIAGIFFGAETIRSYLRMDFAARVPPDMWIESVNESLLSTILKLTDYDIQHFTPFHSISFLVTAAAVGLTTLFAFFRMTDEKNFERVSLFICASLLIYPHTLEHYSAVLLIPAGVELSTGVRRGRTVPSLVFVLLLSLITDFRGGAYSFAANLLGWAYLVAIACSEKRPAVHRSKTEQYFWQDAGMLEPAPRVLGSKSEPAPNVLL